MFLTGANVGFLPVGHYLGQQLGGNGHGWALVPIGMLIGYFLVTAEPAVHVLNKQVETITNGAISQRAMMLSLSIGVACSVGMSMLRVLTGISIYWMLISGYTIALVLTFFVPKIITGIAFDSGGVASGPLTSSFILPFAVGVCYVLGGESKIMSNAFGVVAMVAMTPLITIQLLGFKAVMTRKVKQKIAMKRILEADDEQIINIM